MKKLKRNREKMNPNLEFFVVKASEKIYNREFDIKN
jgi:hypothetical protein